MRKYLSIICDVEPKMISLPSNQHTAKTEKLPYFPAVRQFGAIYFIIDLIWEFCIKMAKKLYKLLL